MISETCSDLVKDQTLQPSHEEDVDIIFWNAAARRCYRKAEIILLHADLDAGVFAISRLDASLTNEIDTSVEPSTKSRGGRVQLASEKNFKRYIMLASVPFPHTAVDLVCEGLRSDCVSLWDEFIVLSTGRVTTRLGNSNIKLTLTINYPIKGRFCMALTHSTFWVNICSWMGTILNCYVRHRSWTSHSILFMGQQVWTSCEVILESRTVLYRDG